MFKLSENIDPNKIFIINHSELEGRFDPIFYASDLAKFNTNIFKSVLLKSIVKYFKSGFGAGKQEQTDAKNGIIQIRPTNIDENGFLKYDKNIYLPIDKNSIRIEVDDIIFNNTNSQELVGKTAILKENKELTFSNHITIIRVRKEAILPDYLWIILNMYQRNRIFYSICTNWNNQSGIGLELLKKLKIPLPPLEIQQQIVDLYEKAYTEKQQKEAEAQRLLDSIDNYLLGELGITLPKEEELLPQNTDKNNSYNLDNDNPLVKKGRLFLTNLSEVTGKRIDPKGYDIKTKLLKSSIDNIDLKKFILLPLKSFIIQSIAGNWGIDEKEEIEDNEEYQKCLVIRATEFDNQYNLNLDNSRVKYRLIKKSILSKIDLKENDLLIEKSGGSPDQPVGRIAIITQNIIKNNILCYSNFIHKIRVDNKKINPEYLFCFLKMMHNIRLTEAMQSQTNGIRNLIMNSYLNQNIIIPISENGKIDIQKQTEIANIITAIREKAKKLQLEAINTLETAKRNIEQMILGN